MGRRKKLKTSEDLDFAYLLELMRPLYNVDEFSLLPELFTILGHEKLLQLSKYLGGQVVRIPTIDELSDSLYSLQWFYDVHIKHTKSKDDIPSKFLNHYHKICEVYDVRNHKE